MFIRIGAIAEKEKEWEWVNEVNVDKYIMSDNTFLSPTFSYSFSRCIRWWYQNRQHNCTSVDELSSAEWRQIRNGLGLISGDRLFDTNVPESARRSSSIYFSKSRIHFFLSLESFDYYQWFHCWSTIQIKSLPTEINIQPCKYATVDYF